MAHARQRFLRDARAGLLLHWGVRTAPAYPSCAAWEAAVTAGGWDPSYWVREARKLRARYLVLATFHSRLGYVRAWPSSVPGSGSTRRDFLGELVDAAKPHGMRVLLYVTDDPQWWAEGLPAGESWLDSAAYSAWKGRAVDLHTRDGFGEFSYDSVVEVMERYADLGGFWIDNDNAYWERAGLYETVRERRPHFTLSGNFDDDTHFVDIVGSAQKTGMTPPYDHPQSVATAAPRLVEAVYPLPDSGEWWFTGTDSPVDRRLTLRRYVANAGSSIRSLIAETATTNGRFPASQEAFNDFADGLFSRIRGSLDGTEGGGYLYGGLKPGFWNDGAHGVTTVSRSDPDQHFVHVLTRPPGGTLRLRDNGYRIAAVHDLRTGAPVDFTQGDGTLTLTGVSTWDDIDTVFAVTTDGREGIYPPSTYTMSATAAATGHPASAAADGDYTTFWDNDRTLPVSLCFDLGAPRRVRYIGVNQREDSVSYARSPGEQSARIRDYRVFLSGDGANWGSPVHAATLPSHRGVQLVDLPATSSRHVRLEVLSTWAAPSDPRRHRLLRVDEAWVGFAYAGAAPQVSPLPYG